MTATLLSDVEARAELRRTRTRDEWLRDIAQSSWRRAKEAEDPAAALRWYERAHRLAPRDGVVQLALAGARLGAGDVAGAAALFRGLVDRWGTAEAWVGVATCCHLMGDAAGMRVAVETALRGSVPTPTLRMLAEIVAPGGWCGLGVDGSVEAPGGVRAAALDGVAVVVRRGRAVLPAGWRAGGDLVVEGAAGPFLGSPLPVRAFAGVEGFVEARAGGLVGWAWHRVEPGRAPQLTVRGDRGALVVACDGVAEGVAIEEAFVRPWGFAVAAEALAGLGETVRVEGPDGRSVLGSPLDPGLEVREAARDAAGGGGGRFRPVWADVVGPAPDRMPRMGPVDVLIPVYRGLVETMACLDSVLCSVPRSTRVIVVEDASPDAALVAALEGLAGAGRIRLVRLADNRGFPGAANAGIAAAGGRDVVLLNSDTLVPPGWLERLRAAAYSAAEIGTATPLTNDGTIVSVPDRRGGNAVPDLAQVVAMDALAQRANAGQVAELPVGVGFCLYVRRDCLARAGAFREDLFAQGYGEENDLCLRARHLGYRHVAALDVYVGHVGATSFGAARAHLVRRNGAILERLHPGYEALVAAHEALDPLAAARGRMDALRWAEGRVGEAKRAGARRKRARAIVFVTHENGGGVEQVVQARAAAAAARGLRAIIVRPAPGEAARVEEARVGGGYPNLVFAMPEGLGNLAALLREDGVERVEIHHLLAHHADITGLPGLLGVPYVSVVHDYARFCPRIALVGRERRYCGEPDLAGCEACVADLGSLLVDDPAVAALVARSGAELRGAAGVIAPSMDAALRIGRHFDGVRAEAEAWEDDLSWPELKPADRAGPLRVVVVGAIGVEKGYEVLLACARDARARGLPISFVVVGFTADDERLMAAGPVFVTGEYREAEATALIQAQGGHLALIPSVWPETWCLALSRAWAAGLPAAVFDIGAPAERVRRTGRGWVLPFGLAAGSSGRGLNDALLRLSLRDVVGLRG